MEIKAGVSDILTVKEAVTYLRISPWTLRHWVSGGKMMHLKYLDGAVRFRKQDLDSFILRNLKARRQVRPMKITRKNKDFTRGAVWVPETDRYQAEIRYPDGSRQRRRFRREREAQRWWASETAKIENGTWNETAPKNITLGKAFDDYREYSKTHHRSYKTYVEPVLRFWEGELGRDTLLAKISTSQIESVKLARAADREPATVDKCLSVLKAFYNWCIRQGCTSGNPVRQVRFFHPNNEVVRYLTLEEYQRLLEAAEQGPWYLRPLIELSANTGLRRGNLLSLRWEEIDLQARVIRKTRTKNSRTLALPLNERVVEILKGLLEGRKGIPVRVPPPGGPAGRPTDAGHQELLPHRFEAGRHQDFPLA